MTRDEQTAISSAELQELVLPGMANHHGTLFAGLGLQLMAKAAFMAARKLARREVVMAGASGIDFMRPIPVGRTLALRAWVSRVGQFDDGVHQRFCRSARRAARRSAQGRVRDGGRGRPGPPGGH